MDSIEKKYFQLRDQYQDELISKEVFLEGLDALSNEAERQNLSAWQLFFHTRKILDQNNYDEILKVMEHINERFKEETLHDELRPLSYAMNNAGLALDKLEHYTPAIIFYNTMIDKLSSEPTFQNQVVKAMLNKSITLASQENYEEAALTCSEVENQFSESNDIDIQDVVRRALFVKGSVLQELNKPDDALSVYAHLLKKFGEENEPEIRIDLISALIMKGEALFDQGKHQEALNTFNSIISQYSDNSDPSIHELIQEAIGNRDLILAKQGKFDFANAKYNRTFFVKYFGEVLSNKKLAEAAELWNKKD